MILVQFEAVILGKVLRTKIKDLDGFHLGRRHLVITSNEGSDLLDMHGQDHLWDHPEKLGSNHQSDCLVARRKINPPGARRVETTRSEGCIKTIRSPLYE